MGFNRMGFGPWANKARTVQLPSGGVYYLPSGQYLVQPGNLSVLQYWDALSQTWRCLSGGPGLGEPIPVSADGYNIRLYNPSGTVVGGYVTNGGSLYPNGIYPVGTPTTGNYVVATISAGLANFNVIVGGAINTTVAITTAGVGYNNPPTLLFSDPPAGGLRASGYATVSGGAITGVVVVDQGAGYTTAPTITVIPHPLDTITTPAVLTVNATLANSGRVTGLTLGPNGGNSYTSTPTVSFSSSAGSGAAATALMNYTVTGVSAVSGGVNLVSASARLSSIPLATAKTNAPVNPTWEQNLYLPREGSGVATISGGAAAALTVVDGGAHQTSSVGLNWALNWTTAALAASPVGTVAVGGAVDESLILSA